MERADTDYISLAEAAKLTTYSQEYISLLCRRGKMKGKKLGRNWFIKTEDVYDYINETKGKGESMIPIRIETKNPGPENEKNFHKPKPEKYNNVLNLKNIIAETDSKNNIKSAAKFQNSGLNKNVDIKKDFNISSDEIDEKYASYMKSNNNKFHNLKSLEAFESQTQGFMSLKKVMLAIFLVNIILLDFIITILAVPFWPEISKKIKAISQETEYAINFLNVFDSGAENGSMAGAEISAKNNSQK